LQLVASHRLPFVRALAVEQQTRGNGQEKVTQEEEGETQEKEGETSLFGTIPEQPVVLLQ